MASPTHIPTKGVVTNDIRYQVVPQIRGFPSAARQKNRGKTGTKKAIHFAEEKLGYFQGS